MRDGDGGGDMFEPLSDNDRELAEATSGNASALIEKLPTPHNGHYDYYDEKGDLCFVVQRYKKKAKSVMVHTLLSRLRMPRHAGSNL